MAGRVGRNEPHSGYSVKSWLIIASVHSKTVTIVSRLGVSGSSSRSRACVPDTDFSHAASDDQQGRRREDLCVSCCRDILLVVAEDGLQERRDQVAVDLLALPLAHELVYRILTSLMQPLMTNKVPAVLDAVFETPRRETIVTDVERTSASRAAGIFCL
jgi:hypothetical protein